MLNIRKLGNLIALISEITLLSACKDMGLEEPDAPKPKSLHLMLFDSKFYAVGERVLSVSFLSDGEDLIVEGSGPLTWAWDSDDPSGCPRIPHEKMDAAILRFDALPGTFSGLFTVTTHRHTYSFRHSFSVYADKTTEVLLDFSSPEEQPVRKVGILGDSISTFKGEVCNPTYYCYYPDLDPNVKKGSPEAVDSKEKTWWWQVIHERMQYGKLDVNSSWTGKRVVHEISDGLPAGLVDRVGDFVDPDIIIIHGGTNDSGLNTRMGSYGFDLPAERLSESGFRNAYVKMVKLLQDRYDGVRLILIIGDRLTSDYENSIITIANHFHLPYVNFVGMDIPKCAGSHPNASGHQRMADEIYGQCKDYLP